MVKAVAKKTRAVKKLTSAQYVKLKPSVILKMAVEDLTAVKKQTDKYGICMGDWIKWKKDQKDPFRNKCFVCLAGASLVMRFNILDEDNTDYNQDRVVDFINSMRTGDIQEGYDYLGRPKPEALPERMDIPEYYGSDDSEAEYKAFMKGMEDLIKKVELAGD